MLPDPVDDYVVESLEPDAARELLEPGLEVPEQAASMTNPAQTLV